MKDTLDLFSALGDRLKDFGGDAASRQVAERACRANGWFTPAEVCRAVRTLSRDMLQRPKLERWLAAYPALPAVQGILDGYQTMDTLAGLNFGAVIALNIQALGVTEPREVERGTIRAGFIAGGMLLVVYAMLTHIGGISGAAFPGSDTGASVLTALADGLFGRVGQVLLAVIFVIACFNTCVGLIASVGEYFHELLPRLPYPTIAAFFALMSMLLANIGLAGILSLSVPVLNAIYPIAIVLIVVEFLPGRFQRTSVWRLSILFTAIQSIPAALPFGPLSALMNALPLSSLGFGWLLPALIGIGVGLLI